MEKSRHLRGKAESQEWMHVTFNPSEQNHYQSTQNVTASANASFKNKNKNKKNGCRALQV